MFTFLVVCLRVRLAQLLEVLGYKPEGHGFSSQQGNWNFSLT
jgi:hypothetical protein